METIGDNAIGCAWGWSSVNNMIADKVGCCVVGVIVDYCIAKGDVVGSNCDIYGWAVERDTIIHADVVGVLHIIILSGAMSSVFQLNSADVASFGDSSTGQKVFFDRYIVDAITGAPSKMLMLVFWTVLNTEIGFPKFIVVHTM